MYTSFEMIWNNMIRSMIPIHESIFFFRGVEINHQPDFFVQPGDFSPAQRSGVCVFKSSGSPQKLRPWTSYHGPHGG